MNTNSGTLPQKVITDYSGNFSGLFISLINIDASYKEDEGTGSAGVIIRDSKGGMIAASTSYIQYLENAQMGEACALREGLLLARHIGANRHYKECVNT